MAKGDVKYIGVSIEDFLEHTEAQLKAGTFSDGTAMKPQAREALGGIAKSLRTSPQLRISSYVFVFSRHVFIVIDF